MLEFYDLAKNKTKQNKNKQTKLIKHHQTNKQNKTKKHYQYSFENKQSPYLHIEQLVLYNWYYYNSSANAFIKDISPATWCLMFPYAPCMSPYATFIEGKTDRKKRI